MLPDVLIIAKSKDYAKLFQLFVNLLNAKDTTNDDWYRTPKHNQHCITSNGYWYNIEAKQSKNYKELREHNYTNSHKCNRNSIKEFFHDLMSYKDSCLICYKDYKPT